MKYEEKAWSPLWLEYSGLPALLTEKVRGGAGWTVFKKIVELDCAANPEPDAVEITLAALAARCGITPAAVRKVIQSLRKLKLIACFLPEHEEEAALLKIRVPLATPLKRSAICEASPRLFLDTPQHFRYLDDSIAGADRTEPDDAALQETVDLYFNTVGVKMNAFILDELRLVRNRFPMDQIRRTFRWAQQNEIHSLHWVVRELIRHRKKNEEDNQSS
jgi:hypothetical protein